MAVRLRPDILAPIDRGIDRVVRTNGTPTVDLPDFVDLAPPEMLARSQLDQLLSLPNIDDFIAQTLRPAINDGQILTPASFRSLLDSTLELLRESAERQPRSARLFGRAARLLTEEANLRDLLHMYRTALLQG